MVYFLAKEFQFGSVLQGLEVEHVGLFYGHLEYIKAVGIFYGHMVKCWGLVYFPRFGVLPQEKSGNPDRDKLPSPFCELCERGERNRVGYF
jgi:hypothetical protein